MTDRGIGKESQEKIKDFLEIKTFADLAFIARERGIYEDSAPVSDTATQDERNAAAKSFLLKTKLAEVLINTFRV